MLKKSDSSQIVQHPLLNKARPVSILAIKYKSQRPPSAFSGYCLIFCNECLAVYCTVLVRWQLTAQK